MAFVAAAQRAALAGISWPTHGFDPQGRAQLAGLTTPEAASPDLTGIELRAALAGIQYPTNFNTAFGRGVAAGFIGADETAPDTIIELFEASWDLIPTFFTVEGSATGLIQLALSPFTASLKSSSFTEETLAELTKNFNAQKVTFNDYVGEGAAITDAVYVKVRT